MENTALVLSAKTARALEILKANGGFMFAGDIAAVEPELFDKGYKSVGPIMVHLGKKGLVVKSKQSCESVDKDGNPVTKELTVYQISPEGAVAEYTTK